MSAGLLERLSLRGRVALVTGGAGHVGREAAITLGELGAEVVLLDRDGAAANEVAKELGRTLPAEPLVLELDLLDEATAARAAARIAERFGRLDVLVQAAALVGTSGIDGWAVPFEDQSPATFSRALDLNLAAPFRLTQALLPQLRAPAVRDAGGASLIHLASIHGVVAPDPGLYVDTGMHHPAGYAASKGGLLALTRWLSTSLAPDVRVNAISPGGIARAQPDAFVRRYEARTPLGRLARESDLSGAIAFLASDLSSYVTGQNLIVDGGYSTW